MPAIYGLEPFIQEAIRTGTGNAIGLDDKLNEVTGSKWPGIAMSTADGAVLGGALANVGRYIPSKFEEGLFNKVPIISTAKGIGYGAGLGALIGILTNPTETGNGLDTLSSNEKEALRIIQQRQAMDNAPVIEGGRRDFTNVFNTPLSKKEAEEYKQWLADSRSGVSQEQTLDYDLQGYWKNLVKTGKVNPYKPDGDMSAHLRDAYKKPNHSTFSDQSVYADNYDPTNSEFGLARVGSGVVGGTWLEPTREDGAWTYNAVHNPYGYTPEGLLNYARQYEQGNIIKDDRTGQTTVIPVIR